jgi:uncharacterized protein YjbJ (UPF0337 family)
MTYAQNNALATLMTNSYNSLQAAGVITTPASQSASAVVGQLYTGTNQLLTSATTTLTNTVNGQVASLVTNASQYGTQLTAQWAKDLPSVTSLTSNLTSIKGLASITPDFAGVKTAMDTLGKASQFAASASSTLSGGLDKLSNLSVSDLTSKLPSASALTDQLKSSAGALAGQIQGQIAGQAKALIGQAQGQVNALIGQAQGQVNALIGQAQGQFNALIAQGDSLVSNVQKAAGFANTVNRATVDTAFTKILGSSKISVPSFGADVPSSSSIGAALDISKAQGVLKGLQGQVAGLADQAQGLVNQAQGQASSLLATARNAVNQFG